MPIMATSFIQMAYSLTDMAWVGRLGSEAVAAVGAVGILTWMSGSIALLNKVGSEVSVAQSIGAQNRDDARAFASHNISIALLIAICWGGLLFVFARPIMSLFELEAHITDNAVTYLRIVSTSLSISSGERTTCSEDFRFSSGSRGSTADASSNWDCPLPR